MSCPALLGNGVGIDSAEFTFVVAERSRDQYGHLYMTEAFGYFTPSGSGPGDDVLQTGSFETPAGSPIGWAARYAAGHPGAQAQIAAILRGNVSRCSCAEPDSCDALSARHLLLALCRVTRRAADNPLTLDLEPVASAVTATGSPLGARWNAWPVLVRPCLQPAARRTIQSAPAPAHSR